MPAVTVDDLTVLDRLKTPGLGDTVRPVKQLIDAPKGYEGEGFPVRRAFAGVDLRDLDPFVHMDQMGEVEYAPGEPKGTPWHPHRGFETVTYIIDGVFDHHDSHGGGGTITNGDTQWMTAGSGLLHIETPPEWLVSSGGLFHGIQLWVNLPRDAKWNPPAYQDIRSGQVGLATSADAGALVRVIAGDLGATKGPGSTYTPMTMVHATVEPGARLDLPWEVDYNALVYVLSGQGTVGDERPPGPHGQPRRPRRRRLRHRAARPAARRAVRRPSTSSSSAGSRSASRSPGRGPFVMNTKAEVHAGVRGLPEGPARHHPDRDARRARGADHPGQHRGLSNRSGQSSLALRPSR